MVRGDYLALAWRDGEIAIKPLTAFGFVLAAVIVMCGRSALLGGRLASLAVSGSAFGLLFLSLGVLGDQLSGWRLSIVDFTELDKHPARTFRAGMPSAGTVLGFVTMACVGLVVIFNTHRFMRRALFGARLLASLGVVVALGYVLDMRILTFDVPGRSVPMAIPTAILFVVLGFGVFALARSQPVSHSE